MGWLRNNLTDTRILMIGLAGALLFSIVAAMFSAKPSGSYHSVRDDSAGGAKALKLWLEDIGYEVKELTGDPSEVDILFILNPRYEYTPEEAKQIAEWVREGHTLIIAGTTYTLDSVVSPYDIDSFYLAYNISNRSLTSPTLINPPFDNLRTGTLYGLYSARPDLVMHMSYETIPILASVQEASGQVWIAGMVRPFTNIGLGDDASGNFILNLLASAPDAKVIGFDEGLHGVGEPPPSLTHWLYATPAGQGILSSIALVTVFLFMQGRRFGRSFPIREEQLRREPVEYIQAMANLLRRSGQRDVTLSHYRQMFHRQLAKRYGIDPTLSDSDLVRAITLRDNTIDSEALASLLNRLSQKHISETDLVRLAMEVDEWSKRIG